MTRARGDAGFTLLEVVVAVAILGIALGTAFELLGVGLRAVTASGEYTGAAALAKRKLAETTLLALAPGTAESGADGRYRWTAVVSPDEPGARGAPSPGLLAVRVNVTWAARGRERSLELVTLRRAGPDGLGEGGGR